MVKIKKKTYFNSENKRWSIQSNEFPCNFRLSLKFQIFNNFFSWSLSNDSTQSNRFIELIWRNERKKMRTMFCVLVSSVPSSDAGPSVVWCAPWGSSEGSHRQAEEPDVAGLRSNKGSLWSTYGCSLGPSPWRKITW
jgi:hypothetical protein